VKVLLARVKNAFRRAETLKEAPALLRAGDLVIDKERQSFTIKGKPVALTKLEFRILGFLMENPGKVYSRDQLLSGAWGGEAFVVDRTVDVHVRSIRQKLGKHRDAIETVRGSGYRFKE
jgi:DNA-binding response OmpR family regulator